MEISILWACGLWPVGLCTVACGLDGKKNIRLAIEMSRITCAVWVIAKRIMAFAYHPYTILFLPFQVNWSYPQQVLLGNTRKRNMWLSI
jgi:hypothetical protein